MKKANFKRELGAGTNSNARTVTPESSLKKRKLAQDNDISENENQEMDSDDGDDLDLEEEEVEDDSDAELEEESNSEEEEQQIWEGRSENDCKDDEDLGDDGDSDSEDVKADDDVDSDKDNKSESDTKSGNEDTKSETQQTLEQEEEEDQDSNESGSDLDSESESESENPLSKEEKLSQSKIFYTKLKAIYVGTSPATGSGQAVATSSFPTLGFPVATDSSTSQKKPQPPKVKSKKQALNELGELKPMTDDQFIDMIKKYFDILARAEFLSYSKGKPQDQQKQEQNALNSNTKLNLMSDAPSNSVAIGTNKNNNKVYQTKYSAAVSTKLRCLSSTLKHKPPTMRGQSLKQFLIQNCRRMFCFDNNTNEVRPNLRRKKSMRWPYVPKYHELSRKEKVKADIQRDKMIRAAEKAKGKGKGKGKRPRFEMRSLVFTN